MIEIILQLLIILILGFLIGFIIGMDRTIKTLTEENEDLRTSLNNEIQMFNKLYNKEKYMKNGGRK